MSKAAVQRIPVEIWTYILDLAIGEALLLPPPSKTIVEDLRFFKDRKEPLHVRKSRETTKTILSLVCRLFHAILRGLPALGTGDSVAYSHSYRRRGDPSSLFGMRTLHIPSDRDGLPPEWYAKKWNSVEVVYTTVRLMDDVIRLLPYTANIKALSCEALPPWSYCRVAAVTRLLSSDACQRLTHLSIYIPDYQLLEPLTLLSLRFLDLDIAIESESVTVRHHGEALPWTCPILHSFSIRGTTWGARTESLIPFFQRHATTVKNLVDQLVQGDAQMYPIDHFRDVEIYGTDGMRLQIRLARPESQVRRESRPITFLMMNPWFRFEPSMLDLQLEARIDDSTSAGSSYFVARLMVNTSWEKLEDWITGFRWGGNAFKDFLARLENIASSGLPLVDWDGIPYRIAKPLGGLQDTIPPESLE